MVHVKYVEARCPCCGIPIDVELGSLDAECPECGRTYPVETDERVLMATGRLNQALLELRHLGYVPDGGCLRRMRELPPGIGVVTI